MRKFEVLWNEKHRRACWNVEGITYCGVINNGECEKIVHSAPVTPHDMIKLFSNEKIETWEHRIIDKWEDL